MRRQGPRPDGGRQATPRQEGSRPEGARQGPPQRDGTQKTGPQKTGARKTGAHGAGAQKTAARGDAPSRLVLFNKPFGVLSQFGGGSGAGTDTLAGYIPLPGVYPAGRLDRDSEGLLLLTADGALQARIADPRFKLPKTYLVQVEGEPAEDALDRLRRGVALRDGPTRPAEAERIAPPALWPRDPPVRFRRTVPDCWLRITLREGRNRQVRRMTAAVGHPTLRLVRWSVGPWTVEDLAPGTWREVEVEVGKGADRLPHRPS